MKTNKILLFLVAVGLLGGNVVAMDWPVGGNVPGQPAPQGGNPPAQLELGGDVVATEGSEEFENWDYLLGFLCSDVSVEEVKKFIDENKLNIKGKDRIGRSSIRVVAEKVIFAGCVHEIDKFPFKYCLCSQRIVAVFEMLLRMGVVTKEDIKDGVEELNRGFLVSNVVCKSYLFDCTRINQNAIGTLLFYLLLKVVHEESPSGFEFCKKLLSHYELFEREDLCEIRVWLSKQIIELAKKFRDISCGSDSRLWKWILREGLSISDDEKIRWKRSRCDAFKDDNEDSGTVMSRLSKVIDLYEKIEVAGGDIIDVVSVARQIVCVLSDLGLDHKLCWLFRRIAIFEIVCDLIEGGCQDFQERTHFLRDTANSQDVGQEEDEQNRGILGSVFDIRFIDGKLVRVPSKLFLSQK